MTPLRRVRLTFASLTAVSVVAVGVIGRALTWQSSPHTGLTVAFSGFALLVTGALAGRIFRALRQEGLASPTVPSDTRFLS